MYGSRFGEVPQGEFAVIVGYEGTDLMVSVRPLGWPCH